MSLATATKKTAKKTAAKKPAPKKAPAKTAAKAAPAKKAAAKKAAPKKPAAKRLVIVESPAKAETISRYLGRGWKVEASQGHVRDLPKSQLGVDVDNGFELKYITIRGRGDILKQIRTEAAKADKVYLATDPDREGEAISWHLAQLLGIDPDSDCRVEFHEVTERAVKEAITAPRPVNQTLVDAQQARRALDRLVGYKISPLLWAKIRRGLSAGRVQSVATGMVVSREQDINDFIPEEYWTIEARGQVKAGKSRTAAFRLRLQTVDGQKAEITDGTQAQALLERLRQAKCAVNAVKPGQRRRLPAPPFTTSSLQQEAGRKLNFTTAKTMQVVQQLYEGVELKGVGVEGLVTYIRTDSVRVSDSALAAVREYIPGRFGDAYLPAAPNVYKGRRNAQDAHEAIRPTDVRRTPDAVADSLSRDQLRLYTLIWNRFVASQMAPALYDTLAADVAGGGLVLRFYGEHKQFPGFTALYEESTDEDAESVETSLPPLKEGQAVQLSDPDAQQHFTQPPPRYTEASLVKAMEELGIGRPSTYAPTITTIITRGYVTRDQKRLYPTELGVLVTELMTRYFPDIVDTGFTAAMEDELDAVEAGAVSWQDVLGRFYPGFEKELEQAEAEIEKVDIQDEVSDVPCELCGAMMVYKRGRYGRFLACPNFPACRNAKTIVTWIDAKCPRCGGRLQQKTSKKGRVFYGCENYPDCDFTSWDKPVAETCPKCGAMMVEKQNRKGEVWHVCTNETCRCRVGAGSAEEQA